jgi:hypothetical protein
MNTEISKNNFEFEKILHNIFEFGILIMHEYKRKKQEEGV